MMKRYDPETILPGGSEVSNDSDVISTVQQITPTKDAKLVQLRRTNVANGDIRTQLLRLGKNSLNRASLDLSGPPDSADRRIAEALVEDSTLGLLAMAGEVQSLQKDLCPLADVINGLGFHWIHRVVQDDDWYAVQGTMTADGPDTLQVVSTANMSKPVILETDVLRLGDWRCLGGLLIADQALYVTVSDPVAGFDVFRAELSTNPARLEPVITKGAQRFAINAAISAICATDRGVLLGTAALSNPARLVGDWGPELLLVPSSGPWDLVAGQPRFSGNGLLLPASSQVSGMGDPQNAAIMAIAHKDGQTVIALQSFAGTPSEDRRDVRPDMFDYQGPIRLLRSNDLENWQEMKHDLPSSLGPVTCIGLAENGVMVGHEMLGQNAIPVAFAAFS